MWVAGQDAGDGKRIATLQLCICADDEGNTVPPTIIFRGTGRGSRRELKQYPKTIKVAWQKKAWADTAFCSWWAKKFSTSVSRGYFSDTSKEDEKLLFCDRLNSQTCKAFRLDCSILGNPCFYYNTHVYLGPPNLTEHWQPVTAFNY